MTEPALSASEMLAWLETTSQRWRALVEANPQVMAMPCDVMGVSTAGGLLQHIHVVELRYAEQMCGMPPTEYAAVPSDSVEAIYAAHERAMALFRSLLESDVDWDERFEFVTKSAGRLRSTRKVVFFHATMHGIRHYAQLATLVRQHGVKPEWPMDYLFMAMERA